MDKKDLKRSKKHVPSFKMPFTPKSYIKKETSNMKGSSI